MTCAFDSRSITCDLHDLVGCRQTAVTGGLASQVILLSLSLPKTLLKHCKYFIIDVFMLE